LPTLPALNLDGLPTDLRSLRGKWVLLMADSGSCTQSCQNLLFTLRQLRLAQGREMGRIERLMLVRDTVPQHLPDTTAGVHIWRDTGGLMQRLPVAQQADVSRFIYVIDPLGNQVLRYRDDTEPRAIIRELGKLLKNNQGLG
jgi:cytochrome oxidase Cu insertion factor (SCO1/SenC/PrrC family)